MYLCISPLPLSSASDSFFVERKYCNRFLYLPFGSACLRWTFHELLDVVRHSEMSLFLSWFSLDPVKEKTHRAERKRFKLEQFKREEKITANVGDKGTATTKEKEAKKDRTQQGKVHRMLSFSSCLSVCPAPKRSQFSVDNHKLFRFSSASELRYWIEKYLIIRICFLSPDSNASRHLSSTSHRNLFFLLLECHFPSSQLILNPPPFPPLTRRMLKYIYRYGYATKK